MRRFILPAVLAGGVGLGFAPSQSRASWLSRAVRGVLGEQPSYPAPGYGTYAPDYYGGYAAPGYVSPPPALPPALPPPPPPGLAPPPRYGYGYYGNDYRYRPYGYRSYGGYTVAGVEPIVGSNQRQ